MIHVHELTMFLWAEYCKKKLFDKNKSPHGILGAQDSIGSILMDEAKDGTFEDLYL